MLINEHPIGAINGANTAFQTTTDYVAGTLVTWRNGQLTPNQQSENGGRDFTLEFAPLAGDQIVATYRRLFP